MASTVKLRFRPPSAQPVTSSDKALVDTVRTRASWIWIEEADTYPPPVAPDFEQRAFRKVFTLPTSKGKPTGVRFVIGADDFFALYVNGVMVQPADGTHDWTTLVGFQVPLPVVQNTTTDTLTLAFRVVNKMGFAGLIVGVQVAYDSGDPDTFFTGLDESWIVERSFDEGWEQPWYSPSSWAQAKIYSPITRPANESKDLLSVGVFEQLPAGATPTTTGECAAFGGHGTAIGLSVGGFIGVLVGAVLAALVIGVLVSFFVMRRKVQRARSEYDDKISRPLMLEPTTVPGRPLYHTGATSTQNQLGGVASPPLPDNRDEASSAQLSYGASSAPFSIGPGTSGSGAYAGREYRNADELEPPTYADSGHHNNPASPAPRPVRKPPL